MQCPLSQIETMTLNNTKGMMPMHSISLLLNTWIIKDLEYDL